ncbi:alpha-L-rhamnosidase C-terminal domain-containing protein [Microbacterium sp. zg-YB36]|uniref:alpha-L-rhamnosidase C-terminal domain-containing protein n=1 Tax=Microbacterium sp. zg-YB36 TaxID=2969407 RepID=UPI00336516CF
MEPRRTSCGSTTTRWCRCYGPVEIDWALGEDDIFTADLTVPFGVRADLDLPATAASTATVDGDGRRRRSTAPRRRRRSPTAATGWSPPPRRSCRATQRGRDGDRAH